MPLYQFSCKRCEFTEDYFHHMNDEKKHVCSCGKEMKREYGNISVIPDIPEYMDRTLGHVRCRRDKEAKMKEKGLAIYDSGMFKGEAGTQKRELYNMQKNTEAQVKDLYKYKGTKYYD